MKNTLEFAVHQYLGDEIKTKKWLDRFNWDYIILNKMLIGDFLCFNGSVVKVIDNPNFKYFWK